MSAKEVRTFRNLASKLVRAEETGKLLGNLMSANLGVREVEEFMIKEDQNLKGAKDNSNNQKNRRKIVKDCMKVKYRDNCKT